MSKKIKIEIEIPAPPEGWGEVEYREVNVGDYFWDGTYWILASVRGSAVLHLTARKLPPIWTPPPEWRAMFGDCWLTRDRFGNLRLHETKPELFCEHGIWEANGSEFYLLPFRPELMPPNDIPWQKCCFKIGAPLE